LTLPFSAKWVREKTIKLIHLWNKYKKEFKDTTNSAKPIWIKIASEISNNQFSVDSEACAHKWKSLKRNFNRVTDSSSQKKTWPYYFEMSCAIGDNGNSESEDDETSSKC
jgi:hypothetical protein